MKKITADDILRLIANPETDKVEFKEAKSALPRSFWESYSAFANTDGGSILLGVREDEDGKCHVQGVKDAETLMQDIWNNANNRQIISANILFNRCVYAVDCGGKSVVVVDVPRALREDKPVYVRANPMTGSYRRNGEGDYHCSEEAVEAMIRDKCRVTADHRLVETLTIADLNQETLQRYRNLFRQCRPDDLTVNADNEEFLVRHNAAKRDEKGVVRPTLAAVLMFGDFNTIQNECPHYFVDYRERLDDNPRYSDRVSPLTVNFSGNLFDFYFRVVSRMLSDVKMPFKLDERLLRVDDTPVHKALRECLANTLIHADYTGRQGIVIEKRFRHVTFANPGTFRIPLDVAIAGGTSDARNDVLFTLFALVEIGEKLGTGLVQLFALWEQNGWPRPEFKEQFDPERTFLTLDYNVPEENTPQKTEGTEQDNYDVNSGSVIEKQPPVIENKLPVTEKQPSIIEKQPPVIEREALYKMILNCLRKQSSLSAKEMALNLGFSERTVMRRLAELQSSGRLRRVGPDKGGHWEVLENN